MKSLLVAAALALPVGALAGPEEFAGTWTSEGARNAKCTYVEVEKEGCTSPQVKVYWDEPYIFVEWYAFYEPTGQIDMWYWTDYWLRVADSAVYDPYGHQIGTYTPGDLTFTIFYPGWGYWQAELVRDPENNRLATKSYHRWYAGTSVMKVRGLEAVE